MLLTMTDQPLEDSLLTREACERLADRIIKKIESQLKELSDLHTPYWDARNDVLKNLIQLGSGSIVVEGLRVEGTIEKRKVSGNVGRGGPVVRATSRSGSIRITHD